MAAAAFYDLDGTLVRTNLVHAFAFTARNQQGLVKSALKTVLTLASVPMFLAADFWNRGSQRPVLRALKGESEDRLRAILTSCSRRSSTISRAPTSSSTNRVNWGCGKCW
jgi:hypothetical protein